MGAISDWCSKMTRWPMRGWTLTQKRPNPVAGEC